VWAVPFRSREIRATVVAPHPGGERTVNNLIAVAYDDVQTAQNVVAVLGELSDERAIVLDDVVIAEHRADGRIKLHVKLHERQRHIGRGTARGAVGGGLIGLLFLAPLLGVAIGGTVGGMSGAMSDLGIDEDFMRRLGEDLRPGGAVVFALASNSSRQKVLPRISPYGGRIIHSTLSPDADAQLRAALDRPSAAQPSAAA
jgi:uncharacterized membrane protein